MAKYNLPLTYAPKIPKVISGECTQTIRAGRKFEPCDLVSFHGWEGKPYRSPWSFRTPYFEIVLVEDIKIFPNGIYHEWAETLLTWDSENIEWLADRDGIDPPTGETLKEVLFSMHRVPYEGIPAQIITWAPVVKRDT